MFNKIFKNSFFRSSIIFSIASFIVSVIGYAINLLIARTFSLADYGEYMTTMSYILFLSVPIATFGMIVIQRIGREKISERKVMALSLEKWLFSELRAHFIPLAIFAIAFSLLVYYKGNLSLPAILFILTTSFLTLFQSFYSSSLQAFKNFFLAGLFIVAIFFGKLIFSIGVIIISPNLTNLFSAFILSLLMGLIFGKKMIGDGKNSLNAKVSHKFLNITRYLKRKNLLITLITTMGLVGLGNVDIILVRKFLPTNQVGLYSSISLLGKIILYIAAPLSQVAFSFFTGSDSKHNSSLILVLLSVVYLFIGGVSTLIYFFFPELVIEIIFGSKFLVVADLIWMAAIFGTLYSLVVLYGQFLISKNSWWGSLAVGALAIQFILIFVKHSSLSEVMMINILVSFVLLIVFIGKIVFSKKRKSEVVIL